MSTPAVQIIARGVRSAAEAAARTVDLHPGLEGVAYSILEEDESRGTWRIDAYPVSETEAAALMETLAAHEGLKVRQEVLADADWLAMALSGLPPVRAGRFFIYGVHDRGRAPSNAVRLRIEAGAAFGTGHHATTVGCLLAFDALLRRRRFARVLDVGSGTGVLAIAAAKEGAKGVIGTDIDRVSVRIARENARLNQARAQFFHASGLRVAQVARAAPFDLVFANILARPLIALAGDIAGAAGPGARIILSGLLRSQERAVKAAYRGHGLILERALRREAWVSLVFKRPKADTGA